MNFLEYLKEKISYFYSFLGGFGLFFLKFLSLNVLIEYSDFQSYPFILIYSGVFLFLFGRINKLFSNTHLLSSTYVLGTAAVFYFGIDNILTPLNGQAYYASVGALFSFFISVTQYSEVNVKDLTFNSNRSIKNSKLINKFILFEEIGLLGAATTLLFAKEFFDVNLLSAIGLTPVAFMLFISASVNWTKEAVEQKEDSPVVHGKKLSTHSFVLFAILLASSILLLKQLFSYGAYIGFKQLKESGNDFQTVFSIVSIAQTVFIFAILGFKVFLQKNNVSWNKGIKWYLNIQFLVFAALFFIASPILLISSSALRKVLTHTILNESMKLLHLNYPLNIKNDIQHLVNSYSSFTAYIVIAGFAYFISSGTIPTQSIWGFGFVLTACAVFFRKKLFNALIEYQISNLLQKNVYEAVNSCYCLAHKEASLYAPTLGSLLTKKPRPMLTKAIIYTLGEMQHPSSIDLLITKYNQTEREDIQLCIIQAIMKFDSHKVDLFLLECLESMVLNQVSLGEIRRTIFTSITNKIDSIAIPMSLRLLKNNQENQRIIANIILIIGELAILRQDKSLFEVLLQYTDYSYSRRIRSNAFLYLFANKEFRHYAMSGISEYIVSNHEHDRSAAAFLAGELKLKGMYHYVKQLSLEQEAKNSTIEISLLKLDDTEAPKNVAEIIFSDDAGSSLTCLNQLNSIDKDQTRYKVYNYILDHHADKLGVFMKLLSDTNRNFDEDRRKIYDATTSRNIEINDRDFLFSSQVAEVAGPDEDKKAA